jgi:hypothetical protein
MLLINKFKGRRSLIALSSLMAMAFAWLALADSYRGMLVTTYRECVIKNAPEEARLLVNIYEDRQLHALRRNCAMSLGEGLGFSVIDEDFHIQLRDLPAGKMIALLPIALTNYSVNW